MSSPTLPKKIVPRVALLSLDEQTKTILRESFRQFGIECIDVDSEPATQISRQKFEAAVLRLDDSAEPILNAARNSPSNRRIVIYGIAADVKEALRYSKYGINTILNHPVDRASALKVVRATHLLVINELRLYVRLPMITEVEIDHFSTRYYGSSREISGGGMSIQCPRLKVKNNDRVRLNFKLPESGPIQMNGTVCWVREGDLFGVRFDREEAGRSEVRHWIENFLEL